MTWLRARHRRAAQTEMGNSRNHRSHSYRRLHRNRRAKVSSSRQAHLLFEPLEERRVLTASSGDLSDLATDTTQYRDSSLIVQFREGAVSPGSLAAYSSTVKLNSEWELTPGMRRVDVDPAANWESVLAAYRSDPNVLFAEPDYRVSLNAVPDDPDFYRLYGLDNDGTLNGTPDADIDAVEAWDKQKGSSSTIVAVIDTGVDYTHPDLAANMWKNDGEIAGDGIDNDRNGYIDDVHGYDFVNRDGDPMDDYFHGTHVAGTIGAVGDNGVGIVGVAWNVQIMALKFLDESGGGYTSDAIAALNYAVANGARISNNSWGGGGFEASFETALKNAQAKGHIFVAAAGNDGWNNDRDAFYPAGYNVDNVVSVAATDRNDELAWFSNYGRNSVDIAAPGVDIYSTFPTRSTPAMRDGGYTTNYASISGTSMATPHVAGVIALVMSEFPDLEYDAVIDKVLSTVDIVEGAAQTVTGGRLNAAAAVGNPPQDLTGPRIVSTDPADAVTGTVSQVTLRFSESIDPLSVSLADVVSLSGPDGDLSVIAITPVAGNSRSFSVTFAPQTVLGEYSLVIGSEITDTAGNLMDQDRDGTGGEEFDDRFTTTFEISDVVGFEAQDVPLVIDSLESLFGQYTESTLTIGSNINVSDLNVKLNIWFPYDGDLKITLISPSGTQVTLSNYRGGEGGDFLDTVFDDEASVAIGSGFAPFIGSYRPDQLLSAFDGQNAQGDWTLRVAAEFNIDHFLDGTGSLNAWSLDMSGGSGGPGDPPPPPPPPPGNRAPVAVDDTLEGDINSRLAVPAAQLLANDTDPDGDVLSIAFVGSPIGGSVALGANALVTFTPDPDFTGSASFQYIVTDGFGHLDTATVTINLRPLSRWSNPANVYDVNADGTVAPGDVLAIINVINAFGSGSLGFLLASEGEPESFLDVNGDAYVAPNDSLDVINFINAHPRTSGTSSALSSAVTPLDIRAAHDAAIMSYLAIEAPEAAAVRLKRK